MTRYVVLFFLCALALNLNAKAPAPDDSAEKTATLQEAQKAIRSLANIKQSIEASILESEDGLWPNSNNLFTSTAQLIISCYKQKPSLNSLHARIYFAVLEDYLNSLSEQEPHRLAKNTPIVKQLTNKALREIANAKKTILKDLPSEQEAPITALEVAIRKTIISIKTEFLPYEAILPRKETVLEKIKKNTRAAYFYVEETVEENPFISGVLCTVAICATIYWVNKKYFSHKQTNLPDRGSRDLDNYPSSKKPAEPPANPNVKCESISSPSQRDGKSCGYHSAENARAFAQAVASKAKGMGRKLTSQEVEEVLSTMTWPTRETIQNTDKAAFLAAEQQQINQRKAQLGSFSVTDEQRKKITEFRKIAGKTSKQQESEIVSKIFGGTRPENLDDILKLAREIDQLEIITNGGGWLDGEGVKKFVTHLGTNGLSFQDTDEEHGFHWDLYEVAASGEGTASIERTMMNTLVNTQKFLAALNEENISVDNLKSFLNAQKTNPNPITGVLEYDQDTLRLEIIDGLSLADLLAIKEVLPSTNTGSDGKVIGYRNAPLFFKFLQAFHKGFPLILNWRQPGHWTCNIVIPNLSTDSKTPIKAKGFVVDSYGSSQPREFKNFLNFLVDKKPLSQEEITLLQKVFSPA